ncbi:hypothetical protein M0R45_016212 [Rubus argutus]|uniref:Uncharacterized protein n=1 Tax=Rubus argutus TaxID=59490 RepID=A0AAW1XSF3_RUBAR
MMRAGNRFGNPTGLGYFGKGTGSWARAGFARPGQSLNTGEITAARERQSMVKRRRGKEVEGLIAESLGLTPSGLGGLDSSTGQGIAARQGREYRRRRRDLYG